MQFLKYTKRTLQFTIFFRSAQLITTPFLRRLYDSHKNTSCKYKYLLNRRHL